MRKKCINWGEQLRVSHQETLKVAQTLAAREQELGEKIQASQDEVQKLKHAHSTRERELDEQIRVSRQETLEVSRRLAAREQEIGARQADIARLIQARVDLERRLEDFRNSLSWRLTAPLRAMAGWFRPAFVPAGDAGSTATGPRDSTTNNATSEIATMPIEPASREAQTLLNAAAPNLKVLLQYEDHEFVECAYQTILSRQPDPGGLNNYLGLLRAGVPKSAFSATYWTLPRPTTREACSEHFGCTSLRSCRVWVQFSVSM